MMLSGKGYLLMGFRRRHSAAPVTDAPMEIVKAFECSFRYEDRGQTNDGPLARASSYQVTRLQDLLTWARDRQLGYRSARRATGVR